VCITVRCYSPAWRVAEVMSLETLPRLGVKLDNLAMNAATLCLGSVGKTRNLSWLCGASCTPVNVCWHCKPSIAFFAVARFADRGLASQLSTRGMFSRKQVKFCESFESDQYRRARNLRSAPPPPSWSRATGSIRRDAWSTRPGGIR
jgi:hypothetical protein